MMLCRRFSVFLFFTQANIEKYNLVTWSFVELLLHIYEMQKIVTVYFFYPAFRKLS